MKFFTLSTSRRSNQENVLSLEDQTQDIFSFGQNFVQYPGSVECEDSGHSNTALFYRGASVSDAIHASSKVSEQMKANAKFTSYFNLLVSVCNQSPYAESEQKDLPSVMGITVSKRIIELF